MSLKDLKLTKEQIIKLQQLLAEEIKDESQQERKELSNDDFIANALDKVQVYVQAGKPDAFVQLKEPLLYKFEITSNGVATGSSESDKFQRADAKEIARWKSDNVINLDCISDEHREQLSQIQTDESTGETYMLVPIDINILIDDNEITPDASTKRITEHDAYNATGAGHTIYMHPEQEEHQAGLDRNTQAKHASPAPPEEQANYDYHMHTFEVPRLSFPFELKFDTDNDRLVGGKVDKSGESSGNSDHDEDLEVGVATKLQDVLEDLEE
ncbi:uncharacterized protein LOC6606567 [Drosophila sechellia]|uniref:GM25959 n=1 Tax=Drosophila sechellia TaxID=7238 RepID=B4HGA6_DROSE|nr:uncharacterized protein LOC6606567 [Drosophila sechellia]EDW42354.1 GM25959 [Drosophila sechellia]